MDYQPYCYLIGWTELDKWYYGSEYSNSRWKVANPTNLWTKYFTSSKEVKTLRETVGEPDVIEIRRTFDTSDKARSWEKRVLCRLKVYGSNKWLNKTDGKNFEIYHPTEEMKQKLREYAQKQFSTPESRSKHSEATKAGMTEEVCRRIGELGKGRCPPHKGQKMSPEFCQKIRENHFLNNGGKMSKEWKTNLYKDFTAEQIVYRSSRIRETYARLVAEGKQPNVNKHKGKKFFNNGSIQKMLFEHEVPEGWIKGRLS